MPELIPDPTQTKAFIKALKKPKDLIRLRAFYPAGHPFKATDAGAKSPPSTEIVKQWQKDGRGVYIVVNDGGDKDDSITSCRAFFCEWDDREKSWQVDAWKNLGLPEPTIQVDTGGKSIHTYWVLKKSIDPLKWKSIQTRLLEHTDADRALKNPSRVMRLAGTFYMNKDGTAGPMAKIIRNTEKYYCVSEIEKALPTEKFFEKILASNRFTEYKPSPVSEIKNALDKIPPRKPGSGTYDVYRNILWGLIKACEETNSSEQEAISLMQSHSPEWRGIEQIARSGGAKITAGTFWYWAKHYGYKPPRNSLAKVQKVETQDGSIELTGEKLLKPEVLDILKILRESDEEYRYNEFTHYIEMDGEVIEDIDIFYIFLAEQYKIKVSKDLAIDCVLKIAKENSYHPVKMYLESTVLDPKIDIQPIDYLATTYLRPEDLALGHPTIYDRMLKATLIAAVKRILTPPHKFDNACVLLGPQGCRKSSFWRALGGPFFSDSLRDVTSKDDLMCLHRSWVMEFSELDSLTSKRHAGQIKAFLSQQQDMFRVPYGKAIESFPRRGIVVGSTNRETGFLQDETGNRRFWIIKTTKTPTNPIDVDGLLRERDNIWCSVMDAVKNEGTSVLSVEDELQISNENTTYVLEQPYKSAIEDYIFRRQNVMSDLTIDLLLKEAVEKPTERHTRSDQLQVSSILREMGYTKKKKRVEGSLKWVYSRDSLVS